MGVSGGESDDAQVVFGSRGGGNIGVRGRGGCGFSGREGGGGGGGVQLVFTWWLGRTDILHVAHLPNVKKK